jgi:hypothetical protein
MTLHKDRKRVIGNRTTSGEGSTTARRHAIARGAKKTDTASKKVDHAAITGMSNEKIKAQTGRTWDVWLRLLDAEGALTMTHGAVARLVHDKYAVGDWWSQMVTVGYERLTGQRERGQRMSGAFEASKSKTFDAPARTLFNAWADDALRRRWLRDVDATVRTATSPRSLRLQWPDGTIVAVWFTSKGESRSHVALAHTKLASRAALEKAKAEWGTRLDLLAKLLATDSR